LGLSQFGATLALADFEKYEAAAKRAARIKKGTKDHIYGQLPDFPPGGMGQTMFVNPDSFEG